MALNNNGTQLDPEYLNTLPKLKFTIAGTSMTGRYDTLKKEIFLLDDKGNVIRHATGVTLSDEEQKAALILEEKAVTPLIKSQSQIQTTAAEQQVHSAVIFNAVDSNNTDVPAPPLVDTPEKNFWKKKKDRPKKEVESAVDGQDGWSEDIVSDESPKYPRIRAIALVSILLLLLGGVWCVWRFTEALKAIGQDDQFDNPLLNETAPSFSAEENPTESFFPTDSIDPPQDETEPASPSLSTENIMLVKVIQADRMYFPGHVITEDDFILEEMSLDVYQTLSLQGGFYTEAELSRLVDLVITTFIPKGSYISYNSISTQYLPNNPWKSGNLTGALVTLPVDIADATLCDYLWGNYVDVVLSVHTKLTSNATPGKTESEEDFAGLDHESTTLESVLVDTYRLHKVLIADALDPSGQSLFQAYHSLALAPVIFREEYLTAQYASVDNRSQYRPHYIQIILPEDQAALLNDAISCGEDISVTLRNIAPCVGNAFQENTYSLLQDAGNSLSYIWSQIKGE